MLTNLELMPWVQKGDKNFYCEELAGALAVPYAGVMIRHWND